MGREVRKSNAVFFTQSMTESSVEHIRAVLDRIYRFNSRRILATLIRLLGDFDLAEDALHDAFAAAAEKWPKEGIPHNPRRMAGFDRPLQGHRRVAPSSAFRCLAGQLAEQL